MVEWDTQVASLALFLGVRRGQHPSDIDEVIGNDSDGQRELHSIAIRIWDGRRSAIRSIRFAASASKF